MTIDLAALAASTSSAGLCWLDAPAGAACDNRGVTSVVDIEMPPFEIASYVANPQYWPGGGCRRVPLLTSDFRDLPEGGQFLLARLSARKHVALLPLACSTGYAWLAAREGRLQIRAGNHGKTPLAGRVPLAAWAVDKDPYRAAQAAFRAALACPALTGKLRQDKPYPEIFRYLGWCSWEEFHTGINEQNMTAALEGMNAGPIPVRYVILDDGHQDFGDDKSYFYRTLRSFNGHPDRFPNNYSALTGRLRGDKVRWLGYWTPLLAGMAGIDVDAAVGDLKRHLQKLPQSALVPQDSPEAAHAFVDALVSNMARHGFAFTKIDFMDFALSLYSGAEVMIHPAPDNTNAVANPFRTAWQIYTALEPALEAAGLALINCNSQATITTLNFSHSNVTRCSGDYGKGNRDNARDHLWLSYATMPWLGQVAWGDHDMFHSCDPVCGRSMAVSKALSGGPVYLSDSPADFVADFIRPLCHEDGLLLRPLAPAAPLPESLFLNPVETPAAYRVVAPLANQSAAIGLYNLTRDETPVTASVSPDDYSAAPAMIQPHPGPWKLPREGLFLYDWYAASGAPLTGPVSYTLAGLEDRLLLLLPIRDGWAVVGRADKYLAPAAVAVESVDKDQLVVTLPESGPLTLYSASGTPTADGVTFADLGGGMWRAELPVAAGEVRVVIRR